MKKLWIPALLAGALWAASIDHPTGNRTTPPTILSSTPKGLPRGLTTEITIEGYSLAGARAVYFSESYVTGRILSVKELPDVAEPVRLGSGGLPSTVDLGPLPARNQVTVEIDVEPDALIGPVRFRLDTPLGTTPEMVALVEPYWGEMPDREPNNTIAAATETPLPAILAGAIATPGDEDYYRIAVRDGEELVFHDGARALGSALSPVIAILAADYSTLAEFSRETAVPGMGPEVAFAHRFEKAGKYYIRIGDYERGGSRNHIYRLQVGRVPLVTAVYPLSVARSVRTEVALRGYNLKQQRLHLDGADSQMDSLRLRPEAASGRAFNEIRLALADEPAIEAAGANTSRQQAQPVSLPVAIDGRVPEPANGVPGVHYYRFTARKGEKLIVDVAARRFGSRLDSLVDVLDAKGDPVGRSVVRAVARMYTVLAERNAASTGLRIDTWNELEVGDYIMVGAELTQVSLLPRGPDEDIRLESFPPIRPGAPAFRGPARLSYLGTSAEAHAIDKPVYKVEIHPPGSKFSSNGLPLTPVYYSNDDGGPGYGKDSLIRFVAPADGEYLVRIRDVQGMGGEDYAYRLSIRPPRPDFALMADPANPNVPRGGRVPLVVTALRKDGFDGLIRIVVEGLPPGLRATEATILPGQDTATLLLEADAVAQLDRAVRLRIKGAATLQGQTAERWADPEDNLRYVALTPPADVSMTAHTKVVELEPGGSAEVSVSIARRNGFAGRVPVEVYGLPLYTDIPAFGLNGVLLNEDQTERTFVIDATRRAKPGEQWIYVAGKVETRSPLASSFAGEPILLRIKPKGAGKTSD